MYWLRTRTGRPGCSQAVVRVVRRHADVRDDDVRGVVPDGRGQRLRVPYGRRDLVAEAGEDADQAVPHQRGVLGEYDVQRHGSSTCSSVGPP